MTANGWFQICFFFAFVLVCARPLGLYMARVFERERTFADRVFRPIERLIYRLSGIDETREMRWTEYAVVMLLFSLVTMLVTYAIERLQHLLPLNPQHLAGVAPDLALNTAASFTTNTNWQSYVPETTMSYLTQMLTLAYHNFFSAAVGIALAIALIRGINVGRNKRIAMADLRDMLLDLGHTNVRTLLNSGNVLFQSRYAVSSKEEYSVRS